MAHLKKYTFFFLVNLRIELLPWHVSLNYGVENTASLGQGGGIQESAWQSCT